MFRCLMLASLLLVGCTPESAEEPKASRSSLTDTLTHAAVSGAAAGAAGAALHSVTQHVIHRHRMKKREKARQTHSHPRLSRVSRR